MKKLIFYLILLASVSCSQQQTIDDKKSEELKTKKEIESGLNQQTIEFERDTTK